MNFRAATFVCGSDQARRRFASGFASFGRTNYELDTVTGVYGFIRRSGGNATICMEPARGATMKLYLPRAGLPEVRENLEARIRRQPRRARALTHPAAPRGYQTIAERGRSIDLNQKTGAYGEIACKRRTVVLGARGTSPAKDQTTTEVFARRLQNEVASSFAVASAENGIDRSHAPDSPPELPN